MKVGVIRHWVAGFIGLTILLGVVGNVILWQEIGTPFGGYITYRNFYDVNIGHIDLETTPTWWPDVSQIGIITAINDQPYPSYARHAFSEAFYTPERVVNLSMHSEESVARVTVPVIRFSIGHFFDLKAIELITAVIFWLLAIIVYQVDPWRKVNRVFAMTCSLVALHRMLTVTTLFLDNRILPHVWELVILLVAAFLGACLFHFALLFPEPIHGYNRFFLYALYGTSTLFTLLFIVARLVWWQQGEVMLPAILEDIGLSGTYYLFGASILFLMGRLIWLLFRRYKSPRQQRSLHIVFIGLLFTLPAIVMLLLPVLPLSYPKFYGFWQGFDLHPLFLAVPLAFSYIILRYQAFRARHTLLTIAIVLAVSALLTNVGLWVWQRSYPKLLHPESPSPILLIFTIALVSSTIWVNQSSRHAFLSRLFQREGRNYTAVNQFGQRVLQETNIDVLPQTIVDALVEKLELEQAVVWLWQADNSKLQLHGQAWRWPADLPQALHVDKSFFTSYDQPLYLRRPILDKLPSELQAVSPQNGIEVLVPLTLNIEPVGLLALGKRWDEEIFDARDLEIVTLIAQQATLFLVAARQMAELRQVPQRMAAVQEQERLRIAQELHDTIQQFLGRLPFYLELSRDAVHDEPDEADKLLERSIADVEQAARTVRQIRNNLAPSQLSAGMLRPLQDLISRFTQRTSIDTQVNIDPEVDQQLSLAGRHALYRVVQQAMDNIEEHAEATAVAINIHPEIDRVVFVIADNGRGFSEIERQQAQTQGSFGLQSMQARINSAGGQFQIASTLNQGTELSGRLPFIVPD